jgi:hypothetical protein
MSEELQKNSAEAAEKVLDVLLQGYSLDAVVIAICHATAFVSTVAAEHEGVTAHKMGEDICNMVMQQIHEQGVENG